MDTIEDSIEKAIEDEGFNATISRVYRRVAHLISRSLFDTILLEMFNSREIDLQIHYDPTEQQKKEGIKTSYSGRDSYYYFVSLR